MRTGLRRILILLASLCGVLVLALLALAIFVSTFDWNRVKPAVAARVSQALGREVTIDGDLHVAWHRDTTGRHHDWLPRLNVSATKVTVGNVPWGKQKTFATCESIDFDLVLWPLLEHQLFLASIHMTEPVGHLERRADGTANWTFASSSDAPSTWRVRFGHMVFDSGKFDLADDVRKVRADIVVQPLTGPIDFDSAVRDQEKRAIALSSTEVGKAGTERIRAHNKPSEHRRTKQRYDFSWSVTGRIAGAPLSGSGHVGGVLGLQDEEEPWPVQGELNAGDTHMAWVGTLVNPSDLSALDLRLWMFGANLADLYPLMGIALPETAKFATDGRLSGALHEKGNVFHYDHFNGRVGQSDLDGSVVYDSTGARPKLSGKVTSDLLQFADLGILVGAQKSEKPAGKAIPVQQFKVDRWRAMDADMQFTGTRIGELPISNIETRIVMDSGLLTLKPFHFTVAGGRADSELSFDGRAAPLKGSLNITARHLKLNELFPGFDAMRASIGEVNGDLVLKAHGESIADQLGNADGEIKMLVDNGTVSKAVLEEAGLNLANILLTRLFGDEQIKINCAATDFKVDDGVLNSQLFIFDTDEAMIRVDGTVDLAHEKLDLTIHPDAKKLRLLSLRSPLHVTGTFEKPDVSVDKRALFTRGGGAAVLAAFAGPAALIPLIAPSGNSESPCANVIAQMSSPAKMPTSKK